MRIAMLGSEWFSSRAGGLNRYFTALFAALDETEGVRLRAAAFGTPPTGGLSLGPVGMPMGARLRSSGSFLAAEDVDVLDTHFAPYGLPARLVGRSKRQIHVVHFQGPWAQESAVSGQGRPGTDVKRLIERAAYGRANGYIVLSATFKGILSRDYGIDPDLIYVISPGVDTRRFHPGPAPDDARRDIVTVRRLEKRMGIDVLLHAWAEVEHSFPENRLVVVGEGSEGGTLRELADGLGLGERVTFTGALSEDALVAQYRAAIMSVVPSTALEGFGLIALESLACGTPVLVSDCGGLPDAVDGLDRSLVVPAGDAGALATRLKDALSGNLPSRSAARVHAESFSWQTVVRRHLDLYSELMTRG